MNLDNLTEKERGAYLSLASIELRRFQSLPDKGYMVALLEISIDAIKKSAPTDDERIMAIEGIIPVLDDANSPVIPDGWVSVNDRLPWHDDLVLVWPTHDFGVESYTGQYFKQHKKGAGWFAQVNEQNYGIEFYPIKVTHWMQLPEAPKPDA